MRFPQLLDSLCRALRADAHGRYDIITPRPAPRTSARSLKTFPYLDDAALWLRAEGLDPVRVSWDTFLPVDLLDGRRDLEPDDTGALVPTIAEIVGAVDTFARRVAELPPGPVALVELTDGLLQIRSADGIRVEVRLWCSDGTPTEHSYTDIPGG